MSLPDICKINRLLHIFPNPDGTVTRPAEYFPTVPALISDPIYPTISKDVPVNQEKNTWVRIFLPRTLPALGELPKKKLPVVIFVHGGGFVVGSPDFTPFHKGASIMSSQLDVMVVSVSYRLAPQHRLPAAYDDVLETVAWVKDGKDGWVKEYGDLSNCVLMGESAGGNIAYMVGLKLADRIHEFKPFTLKGLVLVQPYFGGLDRTGSEIRLVNDSVFPLETNDLCWELSLPIGADRSHEYCDVVKAWGSDSKLVDRVRDLGWFVAMIESYEDPLVDRYVEVAKLLDQKGVDVKTLFSKDGQHGTFIGGDGTKRVEFLEFMNKFWP